MKILKVSLFIALLGQMAHSQDAQTEIIQDKKIETLLDLYKTSLTNTEYYRIQVGSGNHSKAQRIKSNIEIDFPGLSSKIDFDTPTYRVRVGKFTSKIDAERKFNEVRKKYPNAMLLKPKKSTK